MAWRGSPVPTAPNAAGASVGQTYVKGLPVAQLPVMRFGGTVPGVGTGVPGKPISGAYGNPDVSSDPYIPPQHNPYGGGEQDLPQFGRPRVLGVGQETSWRGGLNFSNDKLIAFDRHLISKVGSENSGRNSGFTDPPMDGPARPSYKAINRVISWQQGTDTTANQDDLTRDYHRNAQGMYMGEQGSGWIQVSGGTPGLWQPYGSYAGYTAGPVKGIQSPVGQGEPGDGRQSVFSGPPHGLHSPTMPDYSPILGYYMAVPQMRSPRIDRPSNSTIGGQSFSQLVQPQGQTGTIAQQRGGVSPTNVTAGINWMRNSGGWRGQSGAGNAS